MIKNRQELIRINLIGNQEKTVDLTRIYPLGKIDFKGEIQIAISYDGEKFFHFEPTEGSLCDVTARYLKIVSSCSQEIVIYMGLGYIAERNEAMSDRFLSEHGWGGGDGIYSFDLQRKEWYGQSDDETLFVFGDTFAGQVEGLRRIEPTAMVNNSLGYYHGKKIDFEVARDKKGAYISLFEPDEKMVKKGYLAENLTRYLGDESLPPFVSALDFPRDVELVFDLRGTHTVKRIEIENYHEEPSFGLDHQKRGVRKLAIWTSEDNSEYAFEGEYELNLYDERQRRNELRLTAHCRYIKFVIPMKAGINDEDRSVGLKKVYFFDEDGWLPDVTVSSNSEFDFKYSKRWFWLQDGIILNRKLYIYPCLIEEDLNGIEGFEFKTTGVAGLELNIIDGKIDYENVKMREVPFYRLTEDREYVLPSAIYYNDGPDEKSDGYVYFYGYYNDRPRFVRHMIVGRIRPEEIADLNQMRYFDGRDWVRDMEKAQSLLTHVSCEMSVQPIIEGENKGKYLAVFQYDVNGPQVAYAIGENLWGPFSEPRIIYVTPEVKDFYSTTYTYNAKSHLHLSEPKNILVSYNCNDMSMANNKMDYRIYHPRFLNFLDTSNDD